MGLALVGGLLRLVDQDDVDAGVGGDVGDARAHHAGTEDAEPLHALVGDGGAVGTFLERLLVDEERADHRARGGVHQDIGEPARLDPERGVEGDECAFVDR